MLRRAALAAWLFAAAATLHAQGTEPPPAADLHEQVLSLPVSVKNAWGREFSGNIAITVFKPAGTGPFPLVVMNHGRAIAERRAQQGRQRFEPLARYLVSKGFTVFVPTRLGYGQTYGQADPEDAGSCQALKPEPIATAAADQALAAVELARSLPWVDVSRWVVMGQSVGGLTATAVAWRKPPGLVAAINFAGGTGGNPDTRPGNPCSPQALERLWGRQAGAAGVPMLWIYWQNDLYWGADWPRRWAAAWQEGGGRVEFHQLPAAGKDGHSGLSIDMDHWVPLVEEHLARAGFGQPGLVARPAASDHATIEQIDKLPAGAVARDLYASKFLSAKAPRAFAIGPDGVSGWAAGDWAMGRALGFCQARRGAPCKLYAVDDEVVWMP